MKYLLLSLFVFTGLSSCKAQKKVILQEKITLEELIITEFVKNNKDNTGLFLNKHLYVLGYGHSFTAHNIKVVYLSLANVKEKVEKEGEFNMISMKDIYLEDGLLKTSFTFLTAKKDDEADFTYQDNFNEIYCLKYNCETGGFNVAWCGNR